MELLRQAIRAGEARRWLVVVPRGIAMARLRRELTEEFGHLWGLRLTTMPGLIELLTRRLPARPIRTISQILAEEAIALTAASLDSAALSLLLRKPSAQRAALNTIREMKTAGIDRQALAGCGVEKLRAIARLWEGYDDFCRGHGLIDPADLELQAIAAAETGEIALDDVDDLLALGFVDVPRHHQRLLRALAQHCRLHLRLPSDGGRTGLFSNNEELLRLAGEWGAGGTQRAIEPCRGEGRLGELQQRLFAPLAEALAHDPARIIIASAPRRYDEVEAAGCRIIELLGKGVEPRRIALTMRSLTGYDQYIRDVFARLRIPFYYRRGIPILQAPPVRLAMKLTELGQREVRYDELLGVLRSPYLNLEHADQLAGFIANSKLYSESPENWAARLSGAARTCKNPPPQAAFAALDRFLAGCASIWRGKGNRPALLKGIARQYIRLPGDDGSKLSAKDSDGWERFLEVIDEVIRQTGELERHGIAPAVEPVERLRERLREEMIAADGNPADSVFVVNFFDLGYVDADYLLVLGMDEGSVPGAVYLKNTLLSESDIRLLRDRGVAGAAHLRDTAELRRIEEQAFLLATARAVKRIEFSYPLLDATGREISPSPYLGEIQAILGIQKQAPMPLPGGDIRTTAQVPPYPLALRRQLARRLFRADLPEDDPLALAAYNRLLQQPHEVDLFRRFLDIHEVETQRLKALFTSQDQRRRESDRFSGKIEDAALRQWITDRFGPAYLWSVKSLEKMGVCPFDFFLSYCLGLQEFHLPEEEPPALDEGALLHDIAREFVEGRRYPIGDPESARQLMDSLVEKHLSHFNPLPPAEQPLPLQIMRARISTLMRRFVNFEAELQDRKPLHLEYDFGTRDEPLALSFDKEKIALRGRFDRIDALDAPPAGYKVIDYKRGSSITSFAPSLNGHSLQMPIYILAAAYVLSAPLGDFKGGFYSFRSGEFKEIEPHASSNFHDWPFFFGLVEEPNRKCKAYQEIEPKRLTEIVQELVSQARQGYFPVEGRNKAKVPDLANLVGRWLEVPPEFEGGAAE